MAEAVEVFFSYSHADESLRDELAKHLTILERLGIIQSWHDRRILPGDEWDGQINSNLDSAQVILLLISADFLASRYCWDVEVKRAMERHEAQSACVIPHTAQCGLARSPLWQTLGLTHQRQSRYQLCQSRRSLRKRRPRHSRHR